MKQLFPDICILGLTATATQSVIDDIKKILNIPKCVLFKASFNRPNLFYEIRQKPTNNEEFINELVSVIKKNFSQQSGIVYCLSQKESKKFLFSLNFFLNTELFQKVNKLPKILLQEVSGLVVTMPKWMQMTGLKLITNG